MSGEKSCQGKLFIANFTFGAIAVFGSIVHVHCAVKYGVANFNLGISAAQSWKSVRENSDACRVVTLCLVRLVICLRNDPLYFINMYSLRHSLIRAGCVKIAQKLSNA